MNSLENYKEDFNGESCRPYNVGSENAFTIAELANTVAECFEMPIEVKIAKSPDPNKPPERYVPLTKRAREECGLHQIVDLRDGIRRTIYGLVLYGRKSPNTVNIVIKNKSTMVGGIAA